MSPSFSPAAARIYSGLAAFGIEVTEVHVVLTAPDGSTRDTTISFPPGQDTLFIDIPIPSGQTDQVFTALLELRNDQHVVLFSGTQTVVARSANLPPLSTPVVVIQYTGPGTKTKTVTVSPPDTTVPASASVPFRASAVDSSGGIITDLLVRWTTSDASIATATTTGNAAAAVVGQGRRGVATISAITPSGITGSTRITFVPPPARLVVVSGGAQTGVAGSVLAQPFVVEVQAADNLPVPGATVTFRGVTAGGSVTTASAITGTTGRASTTMTLGRTGGTYQYEAASGALAPVTVTETATPAPPAAVALVSGDQQTDSVGRTLSLPLVVKVTDQFGGPVTGATVTWTRLTGTGAPGAASTTTAADGSTNTTYTLGNTAGTETVSASIAGVSGAAGTATFSVRAISRGAGALSIVSGGGQSGGPGTTLAAPLVARAVDALNNPVANVTVVWSALGGAVSFSNATALTDVAGQVTTNVTLGSTAGAVPVTATAGTLAAATTLTVVAGPAAIISKVAGDGQSASVATNVATAPSVRVTDVAGNPIQGASVAFTVASGGGSATGVATSTNASGIATVGSWKVGATSGANTLTATSGALSTTFTATATAVGPNTLALVQPVPATITVGVPFAAPVQVQLRDASSNPVTQAGVVITATGTVLPANTSFVLTATTAASGVATFNPPPYTGSTGTLVFTLTSPGVTTLTTSAITILPGAATQLVVATQPQSSAISGAVLTPQPAIQLADAGGNAVATAGVNVQASITQGGGTLGGTSTISTNAAGRATYTNLTISGSIGSRVLGFTAGSLTGVSSSPIAIGVGPGTIIALLAGAGQTATVATNVSTAPSVKVADASGNGVPNVSVTFSPKNGSKVGTSTSPATFVTNGAGIITISNWTLGTVAAANADTLDITSAGLSGSPIQVVASATPDLATQWVFQVQPPGSVASGAVVSPAPSVRVTDQFSNAVALANTVVSASLASGPGTIGGTLTATTDATGLATFANLILSGPTGAYQLSFGDGTRTPVTSGPVNVSTGPAANLAAVSGTGQSATAGTAVSVAPSVRVTDASNNPVAGVSVQFTAVTAGSLVSNGVTTAAGVTVVTNVSGIAQLTQWQLSTTAGQNSLTASASVANGSPFTFLATGVAGTAGKLLITTQPSSSGAVGVALGQQPVVQLADATGNPVALSGVQVTATIASGTGTLTNAQVTTSPSGTVTFIGLAITGAAGPYVLQFDAPGVTSATSGTITLATGPAVALSITTQPAASAQSGVALAPQPAIQLRDAGGNPVAAQNVVVNVNIATGGGTITSSTSSTNAAGLATFAGLTLTGTAGPRTLQFTGGGLLSVTSSTVNLTSGAPATIVYNAGNLQSAQAGTAVSIAPSVLVTDAGGFPVPNTPVVFAVASGGGTATGLSTNTNASGIAAVGSWTLGTVAGANTLTATAGAATITFSATGTSGSPTRFIPVSVAPTSITVGVPLSGPVQVQLADAANNPVNQAGVSVTLTLLVQPGALTSSVVTSTDAAGVATWTLPTWTGGAGTGTLTASAAAFTSLTTPTFNVLPGAAATLQYITSPPTSAAAGVVLAPQPVLQIADVGGNAVSVSQSVTAAIASGSGATLLGTTTTVTNAQGRTTFSDLAIGGTAGVRTLVFSSGALVSAPSNNITVGAGTTTTMSLNGGNGQQAAVGSAVATPPSVRVVDAFNNPVSGLTVTFTVGTPASQVSNGGPLGSSATVTTNASGIAALTQWVLGTAAQSYGLSAVASVNTGSPVAFTATAIAGPVTTITVTPNPASLAPAATQQFTAVGTDANNNVVAITPAWAVINGGGSISAGGLFTAGATANSYSNTVQASANAISGFASVTVTAGAATRLALVTAPSAAASSGVPFGIQPAIQIQDANGNPVAVGGSIITAQITTGTGGLTNSQATTNASGLATFSGLTITGVAGSFTLQFGQSGYTSVSTSPIAVTAGAASQLGMAVQPSASVQGGTLFPTQPTIQVQDASGNSVPLPGTTVTVVKNSGPGTLGGTLTAQTNASGVATFTDLVINGALGTHDLRFSTTTGLASVVSSAINVVAGAGTQLALVTPPAASTTSGSPLGQQPVVQLRDATGNNVSTSGIVITAMIASGSGSLTNATATTSTTGAASFSGLALTGIAGSWTLQFSTGGYAPVNSSSITVSAGPLSAITVSPSAPTLTPGLTQQFTAVGKDASNNVVSIAPTWSVTNGGGTISAGGLFTAGNTAGNFTNTVRAQSGAISGTASVLVTAGTGTQLTITTPPSSATSSGVALATQPVVQLKDAFNNTVTTSGVVVTASIATGSGSLVSASATTVAGGAATFSGLAITGLAGSFTLAFDAPGYSTTTSGPITLSAGAPAAVTVSSVPSSQIRSGILISQPFDIQIRDAGGNPVAQAGVPVAAAITGGGTLSGTLTVNTNASGLASFTNLTWTGLAGANSFGFSSPGLSSAAHGPITLAAGNASTLVLTTAPPTSATSGVALTTQPRVQLQDGGGNVIAQASVQVTASVTPASGTVTNTVATTTGSGTATFGGLTISGPPGSYVLQFTASGMTPVSSASITLAAGAPTQLVVVSAPITAGILTTNPVSVEARDAGNIPVAGVSISIAAAGGASRNGTPSATTLTTAGNGQVSFNWKLSNRAKTDTLSLTASGVTGPNYALATATAGPASMLAFGTQPAGSTGGIAMPAFTVIVTDSGGVDTVSTSGQVAISIKNGTGAAGATASGTRSVAPVNGVATFAGIAIDLADPTYQLDATLSGLLGGVSSPFAITTGAAAQLRYVQQPTNAIASVAIAPAVTVELTDAGGNRITSNSTNIVGLGITAASGTSGAVLTGGTAVTLASGVATFPALAIDLAGSSYTLIAASNLGSFTKISSTFDITPNGPASVTTLSGPKQVGVPMGQIPSGIITFLVKNAAGAPVPAGTTVNLSSTFPAVCGPSSASMTTISNGTVSPQVIIQAGSGSCEVIAQVAGVTQPAYAQVVVPTAGSTHVWFGGATPNTTSFDQASNWALASLGYSVATAAPSSSADIPYVPFWPLTGGRPVLQSSQTIGNLFVAPGVTVDLNSKTLTTGSVMALAADLHNGTVVVRGTNVSVAGQFANLTIGGGGTCGSAARESAYVGFVIVDHAMKVLCTAFMDTVAAVDFSALPGSKLFVRPGGVISVSDTAAFEGDSLYIGDTASVNVSGRATFGGTLGMDSRSDLSVGGAATFHGLGALYGGYIRVDGNVTFGGAGSAGYAFSGGSLDLGGNFTQLPGLSAQTFRASNYHFTNLSSTVQPQTITMSDPSNELDNIAVQSTMGATLLTNLNLAAMTGSIQVNGANLTISSGKTLFVQRLSFYNNAFLTDHGTITLPGDECYFDGTYLQGTTITGTGTINGTSASTYVCRYFNGGADKLPANATRSMTKRDPMPAIRARLPAVKVYVKPMP